MRLVLDTNVVISGLLWIGSPRELLALAKDGRYQLFTSAALLEELTTVLERSKFKKKLAASGLTADEIVDRYALLAKLVRVGATQRIVADPNDDVVIATALAAEADLIVSGDSHLLALKTFKGIRIVRPGDRAALRF